MIIEDYVSFETAKLLKEKGFDCRCACISHPQWGMFLIRHMINNTDLQLTREYELCIDKENFLTIPTLQMAMKWLREVHNLYIEITTNSKTNEFIVDSYRIDIVTKNFDTIYVSSGYDTYEEACEAAIKYCLEHLI